MQLIEEIRSQEQQIAEWRRDIHAHPELAFEEIRTSQLVADKLESFGINVHRGLGKTGVVGTLSAGSGTRSIALRADMDALPIRELNGFPHRSVNEGKMHACGHDGHTAMLLGAARYLAANRNFDGTVQFIFQPAEEGYGGALAMIEDGLFEQFPVEAVYGMHNWPGLPAGQFAVRSGTMMAAADMFDIRVRGKGSHAAMPHQGVDPVLVGAHIITALQSLASRATDPADSVVVSVTRVRGGDAYNVISDEATLKGTVRTLLSGTRDRIEQQMAELVRQVALAFGAAGETHYKRGYPPTINAPAETEIAATAAATVVSGENVLRDLPPCMGAEDFSFMLERKPGCYIWIGNGPGQGGCVLHNPHYDFNDEILSIGASYWVRLVEQSLAARPSSRKTEKDRGGEV